MIEAGILENPHVDAAIASHVWNEKPFGWLGIANGPAMAGAEIVKIKVIGRGGHGAVPSLAVDPVYCAAEIVGALQGIISRNLHPLKTAVLSICTIHGGEAFNVIPPYVEMSGTVRTFEKEVRTLILSRLEETAKKVAEGLGCKVELEITPLTPATINDPGISRSVQSAAHTAFPEFSVDNSNYQTMGSEDFAFVLEKVPGCFIFIGSANHELGIDASHHHPKFDIDERALSIGTALMSTSILKLLD
jgi:amidohydrolase